MRRIKFALFLLIALLLFSGCTNSQKEYQSLVGTWETSIDYTPLGYSDIVIYQLTFEKDLTGTLYISESSTSPETSTHFDYSVENNYITLLFYAFICLIIPNLVFFIFKYKTSEFQYYKTLLFNIILKK